MTMPETHYGTTGIAFTEISKNAGPALILAGSLGADRSMWFPWVDRLARDFQVIAVEWPGHGAGKVVRPFTVEDLANDVEAYVRSIGTDDVSYCGLSLGGAVGQAVLAHQPALLRNVVLVASGLTFATPEVLVERSLSVCRGGLHALADASRTRWFAETGKGADSHQREAHVAHLRGMEPLGYALSCLALSVWDGSSYIHEDRNGGVLVIAGEQDVAVPVADVERVATALGCECVVIQDAGHLVNVDQPQRFAQLVEKFLRGEMRARTSDQEN